MLRPNARSPSITSQESYSAVMITDMIADVNVNPELEGTPKSTKEETNLAFDGHMDGEVKSSPLEDVDSTKINGSGISKGVILNAVQFSSNDSKKTFDKTSMQLTATLAAPTMTQPVSEPKGFKDMTLKRKIAFGFSFLPSIFFVLCFAVILPCKVPRQCVEETWIATFNNTEPVSGLELTKKIVLTAFKEGRNVLLQLEKRDGKSEEIELPSSPAYLKCGNVFNESEKDCMVMDESGKIYTFNDTDSKFLWNPISEKENLPPPPLILSGCNEKLEAVVIAVSNTIIKFLLGGNKISNFLITHCDSVPEKMMSWKTGDSSDIAFVCNKDGEDRLVKIPGNAWCDTSQNFPKKTHVLKIGVLDSLRESIIKPLGDDGLALWLGDEVSVIQSNGTLLWKISNFSHPEENRFILHGKFLGENKHLAFISSNLTYGLQVTFLNPSDGSFVKKLNFEKKEALDISHIEGKKGDFVILLLRKLKPTSGTMTAAFTRITDISSTIVSMLSNEKLYEGASGPLAEELSILDQDGNLELVKEIRDVEDSTSKSTMKAIIDEDGTLNVYLLSALGNSQMKTTEVKNINVANWDKSLKSKCLAK